MGIIVIAAVFLLSFYSSSVVPRQREDNQTIYFYGGAGPYVGAWVYYGIPEVWYRMFEPYDSSQKYLFITPSITNFINFFVNLAFWMAISVTLVYCGKFLTRRTRSSKSPINFTKI